MLRTTGALSLTREPARLVMRGLPPRAALGAARAFLAAGVNPGRRAWTSLLCSAARAGDVTTLRDAADVMRRDAGVELGAVAHVAMAEGCLLEGDVSAAAGHLRSAVDALGEETPERLAAVLDAWAKGLKPGTAVPGGAEGLAQRCADALSQLPQGAIPWNPKTAFQGCQLVDGPLGDGEQGKPGAADTTAA